MGKRLFCLFRKMDHPFSCDGSRMRRDRRCIRAVRILGDTVPVSERMDDLIPSGGRTFDCPYVSETEIIRRRNQRCL